MSKKYSLAHITELEIDIKKPQIIFLYGDLWAGKTTLSQSIIQKYTIKSHDITSPTYMYYNKYEDITHFDLYRCRDYDEFISIGWEEILDNNEWIILIEWPQILEKYYKADIEIYLSRSETEDIRKIDIKNN